MWVVLSITLGFHALVQQPWLSSVGGRAVMGCAVMGRAVICPVCMARLPKAFRGGGQNELWEGAIWEGRVAEITVSDMLGSYLRPRWSVIV
jgi:hypothetical protein